jgi:hypothetical protein
MMQISARERNREPIRSGLPSLIQQNIDRRQIANRRLRIDIEFTQRFDLIAEEF